MRAPWPDDPNRPAVASRAVQTSSKICTVRSGRTAVIPRLPRMISFQRSTRRPNRRAASTCPGRIGLRYSFRRISPGGIAGPSQSCSLVIVFDTDFVGIAVLPPERDARTDRSRGCVPSSVIALEQLEPVASRHCQIVQTGGRVKHLSLRCTLRHSSCGIRRAGARVSLTKEVRRWSRHQRTESRSEITYYPCSRVARPRDLRRAGSGSVECRSYSQVIARYDREPSQT